MLVLIYSNIRTGVFASVGFLFGMSNSMAMDLPISSPVLFDSPFSSRSFRFVRFSPRRSWRFIRIKESKAILNDVLASVQHRYLWDLDTNIKFTTACTKPKGIKMKNIKRNKKQKTIHESTAFIYFILLYFCP